MVAVLLTLYFAFRAGTAGADGDAAGAQRAVLDRRSLAMLWDRFPKFVLGFLLASIAAAVLHATLPEAVLEPRLGAAKELQTWALTLAFVAIGLEFHAGSAREAGWRPVLVFAAATVVNLVVGLGLALLLFSGFSF